jgi:hypothetical protein
VAVSHEDRPHRREDRSHAALPRSEEQGHHGPAVDPPPLHGLAAHATRARQAHELADNFHLGAGSTNYDRTALMRLTLFTGKAVPSGFPRYLIPQLVKHLKRKV